MIKNLADARRILMLTLGQYSVVRTAYFDAVDDAVIRFLKGSSDSTAFKRDMQVAISRAYQDTAQLAWQDAGQELPLDSDTFDYTAGRIVEEYAHASTMAFMLKNSPTQWEAGAPEAEGYRRAAGYAQTLDSFYANVKASVSGRRVMLTFAGTDGNESCDDCRKYKGKRHSAQWWFDHDAVPPNRDFECHGYRCEHCLVDDQGKLFSI